MQCYAFNEKIIISNVIYILIFALVTLLFLWADNTGSGDPSGKAMMDGFIVLIGLALLLLLGIGFVIYNLNIARTEKGTSLKLIAIIFPLMVFVYVYFGIGNFTSIQVEEFFHISAIQ